MAVPGLDPGITRPLTTCLRVARHRTRNQTRRQPEPPQARKFKRRSGVRPRHWNLGVLAPWRFMRRSNPDLPTTCPLVIGADSVSLARKFQTRMAWNPRGRRAIRSRAGGTAPHAVRGTAWPHARRWPPMSPAPASSAKTGEHARNPEFPPAEHQNAAAATQRGTFGCDRACRNFISDIRCNRIASGTANTGTITRGKAVIR